MRPAEREKLDRETRDARTKAQFAATKITEATLAVRDLEQMALTTFDLLQAAQQSADEAGLQMLVEMTPEIGSAYRAWRERVKETRPAASIDPMDRIPAFLREAV